MLKGGNSGAINLTANKARGEGGKLQCEKFPLFTMFNWDSTHE